MKTGATSLPSGSRTTAIGNLTENQTKEKEILKGLFAEPMKNTKTGATNLPSGSHMKEKQVIRNADRSLKEQTPNVRTEMPMANPLANRASPHLKKTKREMRKIPLI